MFLLFPFLLLGYLLLGLAVSRAGTRWAGRRFQSRLVPWVVFVVLFTAFFGDEIFGYWHWQYLCRNEGGLHVYKRVPVEGFYIDGRVGEGLVREYLKINHFRSHPVYQFVEGVESNQLYRYSDVSGDEFAIRKEPIAKMSSEYAYSPNNIILYPPHVWAIEEFVYDLTNKNKMGMMRSFGYKGATIVRFFRKLTGANYEGSAEYCGSGEGLLVNQAIPPIISTK